MPDGTACGFCLPLQRPRQRCGSGSSIRAPAVCVAFSGGLTASEIVECAQLAESLGYDSVWYGILMVVVVEVGLITPPVGLNIFVIRAQLPDIALGTVFRGIVPFLAADAVLIALLLLFPQLALWLPGVLYD